MKTSRFNPLRSDPSRTGSIRRKFESAIKGRFSAFRKKLIDLIVGENAFGITTNARFQFHTDAQKLEEFRKWLGQNTDYILMGSSTKQIEENFWEQYIQEAYKQGQGRAFDDLNKPYARGYSQDNSTKDFYSGTKHQFLQQSFGQPETKEKIQLLAGRTFSELKGMTDAMIPVLSRNLVDGLARGDNPRTIAAQLEKSLGISESRATTIARSEIIRAHSEGALDAMEKMGVEEVGVMVEWSSADDSRVCPLCKPLDGIVLKISEARGMFPRHPNCLVGNTIVQAEGLVAATKALYSGDIYTVSTKSGARVSVTANHIFLTEFGFIPAHMIYEGLKLLDARGVYAKLINTDNRKHVPTTAQDIFETLSLLGNASVPRRPMGVDFHGDGKSIDSEISIVWANGILGSEIKSRARTQDIENRLSLIHFSDVECRLPTRSSLTSALESVAYTFDSSMGSFRELQALLLGRLLHSKVHRLASSSAVDSSVIQSFIDNVATTVESFRKCLSTHPILKQFNDLSFRDIEKIAHGHSINILSDFEVKSSFGQVPSNSTLCDSSYLSNLSSRNSRRVKSNSLSMGNFPSLSESITDTVVVLDTEINPSSFEPSSYSRFINTKNSSNLPQCFPRSIQTDQVIRVEVQHVKRLPVYDVQTQSSLIIAGNITQSQCRCSPIPAGVGEVSKKQKKSQTQIDTAIDESIEAEIPKKAKDRTVAEQKDLSKWQGTDAKISQDRPRSVLDGPIKGISQPTPLPIAVEPVVAPQRVVEAKAVTAFDQPKVDKALPLAEKLKSPELDAIRQHLIKTIEEGQEAPFISQKIASTFNEAHLLGQQLEDLDKRKKELGTKEYKKLYKQFEDDIKKKNDQAKQLQVEYLDAKKKQVMKLQDIIGIRDKDEQLKIDAKTARPHTTRDGSGTQFMTEVQSKEHARKTKEAAELLANLTAKREGQEQVSVDSNQAPAGTRAFSRKRTSSIYTTKDTEVSIFAHELGHQLEDQIPGIQALAQEFRKMRIERSGTVDENLSKLFPGHDFGPDEVGNKDDWEKTFGKTGAYYVGKTYANGATEIISKGIEEIMESPTHMAKNDPEYFNFIIGVLRGVL